MRVVYMCGLRIIRVKLVKRVGNWSETQNVNELSIESTVVVFLVYFGFLWFSLVYFDYFGYFGCFQIAS